MPIPCAAFRLLTRATLTLVACCGIFYPKSAGAQSLQTVNMAIPAKSFQMVIYSLAQQKGYMKDEGLDLRVIFIAPTTSIQAMLGGDVQFTGAGTSALVTIARSNTPLKVVAATNDRVLQWLVTKPEIASAKDLKGKKIATRRGRDRDVHAEANPHQTRVGRQQRRDLPRRRPG